MKVIKRDGREQEFNINKIKTSIERASDDTGIPMNESDAENISKNIEKEILKNYKESISYLDIRIIVEQQLIKDGFNKVAEAYKGM